MLIKNARILSYGVKENIYDILVKDGKIIAVDSSIDSTNEQPIDAKGKYITTGLIDAHTHLGLKADGMADSYSDHNEKNSMLSPHLRAIDGINPQTKPFIEARNAGITACGTGPGSLNLIGGQFACIKTYGKTIDDIVLDPFFAMKVSLGENPKKAYDTTRMGLTSALREFLKEAQQYAEHKEKYDKKLEAMIPVIKKEKALKIHCHQSNDIVTGIRICEEFGLKYTLDHVTGGADVIEYLNARKEVPLLLGPSLGSRGKVELVGKCFENAVRMAKDRDVCIITDAPVIPLQYLPICVGIAISKGMPYSKALEAVTINPAKVMGVEKRVGSIAVGKDADLIIWREKPFITIQDPEYVIIDGNIIFSQQDNK